MADNKELPWVQGPIEILQHAESLRQQQSDASRRLCFLTIDIAVEVMLRTFLSLPKRISQAPITRQELQNAGESFPRLVDLLEAKAKDRLQNVDLGEVEYYHRQRNLLYHNGAGITIEARLIDGYFIQASYLALDLFGVELSEDTDKANSSFLLEWARFERWVRYVAFHFVKPSEDGATRVPFQSPSFLIEDYLPVEMPPQFQEGLRNLAGLRNYLVHGLAQPDAGTLKAASDMLGQMWKDFDRLVGGIADVAAMRKGFQAHLDQEAVDPQAMLRGIPGT